MRLAVPLSDLDALWRTPRGAAVIEFALDVGLDEADVVSIGGTDAVQLCGARESLVELASTLLEVALPIDGGPVARVFVLQRGTWARVTAVRGGDVEVAGARGGLAATMAGRGEGGVRS